MMRQQGVVLAFRMSSSAALNGFFRRKTFGGEWKPSSESAPFRLDSWKCLARWAMVRAKGVVEEDTEDGVAWHVPYPVRDRTSYGSLNLHDICGLVSLQVSADAKCCRTRLLERILSQTFAFLAHQSSPTRLCASGTFYATRGRSFRLRVQKWIFQHS